MLLEYLLILIHNLREFVPLKQQNSFLFFSDY